MISYNTKILKVQKLTAFILFVLFKLRNITKVILLTLHLDIQFLFFYGFWAMYYWGASKGEL